MHIIYWGGVGSGVLVVFKYLTLFESLSSLDHDWGSRGREPRESSLSMVFWRRIKSAFSLRAKCLFSYRFDSKMRWHIINILEPSGRWSLGSRL